MALLGFVLECAAIAALLGIGACALVMAAAATLRPVLVRLSPSARADLAFLAGVLPAIVVIAGTAAAAVPSIASALGIAGDHCLQHDHHLHVCIIHRVELRPDLAALGAAALAAWLLRTGSLIWNLSRSRREALALERLGVTTAAGFPVVEIPGAPRLCHALGSFRRRILLSKSLGDVVGPVGLRSALAHEAAHLKRRDPLANLIMSLAGLFVPPPFGRVTQRAYRAAAEQACDDDAACAVGDRVLVAEALVAVAKVQHAAGSPSGAAGAFGFGQHPIEARVRRLLASVAIEPRRAHALPAAAGLALGTFFVALHQTAFLHHAVETALYLLF